MLEQKLNQKLLQKLSPQQIQLMKLLQVPTASLEQRLKQELESNPALEEGEQNDPQEQDYEEMANDVENGESNDIDASDIDLSDYYNDDDVASYKLGSATGGDDEEEDKKPPIRVKETYQDHLQQQVGLLELNEREHDREHELAMHLVGSIDDEGYLRRELDAIVDDLAFTRNVYTNEEELERLLEKIQTFDPPGTGARDLRECLLIQLRRIEEPDKYQQLAEQILQDYFEAFTKKHYTKLKKALTIDDDELKEAIDVIVHLNPKPGSVFAPTPTTQEYVVPDFIITNNNGELELTLNSRNAPDLKISDSYREMLKSLEERKHQSQKEKETAMFVKQKLDSAKWFIDAIKQRQQTMLKTMRAIIDFQYDYFLTGDETQLKPMILKDIAERIGMDISTVSRVVNSKYVQTEFGTFPLKSFFSESLQTQSGEEVSTREVKKILSDYIENEDKKKPLSDQKLTDLLKEKGYNIARRTVAKYREQMNLPVARLRKEL